MTISRLDVTLRSPQPSGAARVLHLFRQVSLAQQSQILVAVKARPVERFVGGIAGWTGGEVVLFTWPFSPTPTRPGWPGS